MQGKIYWTIYWTHISDKSLTLERNEGWITWLSRWHLPKLRRAKKLKKAKANQRKTYIEVITKFMHQYKTFCFSLGMNKKDNFHRLLWKYQLLGSSGSPDFLKRSIIHQLILRAVQFTNHLHFKDFSPSIFQGLQKDQYFSSLGLQTTNLGAVESINNQAYYGVNHSWLKIK